MENCIGVYKFGSNWTHRKIQKTSYLKHWLTYDKEIKVVLKLLSKIKIKLLTSM